MEETEHVRRCMESVNDALIQSINAVAVSSIAITRHEKNHGPELNFNTSMSVETGLAMTLMAAFKLMEEYLPDAEIHITLPDGKTPGVYLFVRALLTIEEERRGPFREW